MGEGYKVAGSFIIPALVAWFAAELQPDMTTGLAATYALGTGSFSMFAFCLTRAVNNAISK